MSQQADMPPRVDFGYAFGMPHRLTAARPDSADKTLIDVWPTFVRLSWSYEDLSRFHPMAYAVPLVDWEYDLTVEVDDALCRPMSWVRRDGWRPAATIRYEVGQTEVTLELVACTTAFVVRARATGAEAGSIRLIARKRAAPPPQGAAWSDAVVGTAVVARNHPGGYNVAWPDRSRVADVLVAGYGGRADRVIMVGSGEVEQALSEPCELRLTLCSGRTAHLIRPYDAIANDVDGLRVRAWDDEIAVADAEWDDRLAGALSPCIPDPAIATAFRACLADIFVMRETLTDARIVTTPGTEVYRAPNTGEAAFATIALDQVGLHEAAAAGFELPIANQAADGNWADPTGWMHAMWCCSGFKAWAVLNHYHLTGDRAYLERVYPRLLASARWQDEQRSSTRALAEDGSRPATFGLMPRGMGDCGLREGDDIWGVFLPHNIWAVYGDLLAAEAARILGLEGDARELDASAARGLDDLRIALDIGAIDDGPTRWIPGSPGRTSGSRWGALNVAYPTRVLEPDHPLVSGTVEHVRRHVSAGGIPMNMGWMRDGMWVAIALDNLAEVLLTRDDGRSAVDLLYAVLNHATPLVTWCEERGPEPGTQRASGDRQHLYTPVSVVRFVRDALVMEHPDGLHLGLGVHPGWLGPLQRVGVHSAPTALGRVSWEFTRSADARSISGWVEVADPASTPRVVLHFPSLRGHRLVVAKVDDQDGVVDADANRISWAALRGRVEVHIDVVADEDGGS